MVSASSGNGEFFKRWQRLLQAATTAMYGLQALLSWVSGVVPWVAGVAPNFWTVLVLTMACVAACESRWCCR
jgi:hypothetical protein